MSLSHKTPPADDAIRPDLEAVRTAAIMAFGEASLAVALIAVTSSQTPVDVAQRAHRRAADAQYAAITAHHNARPEGKAK